MNWITPASLPVMPGGAVPAIAAIFFAVFALKTAFWEHRRTTHAPGGFQVKLVDKAGPAMQTKRGRMSRDLEKDDNG